MEAHAYTEPVGGDVDHGWALLAVCWSFVLCAFVTTALRVIVRSRLTRNLGWDDFWMVVAMVGQAGMEERMQPVTLDSKASPLIT